MGLISMDTQTSEELDESHWSIRDHITITEGVCGGKPRIAGHRITVQNIVIWHERVGMTPDEIVAIYPQLTLADVHAALAYFWDHHDQIRAQIEADESFADSLRESNPSLMSQKLLELRGSADSTTSG